MVRRGERLIRLGFSWFTGWVLLKKLVSWVKPYTPPIINIRKDQKGRGTEKRK